MFNSLTFKSKYSTVDLMKLATGYPYKKKDSTEFIKHLTGTDINSDEFVLALPKGANTAIAQFAIEDYCGERVAEQNHLLKRSRDLFVKEITPASTVREKDNWFEQQLQKVGKKSLDITPFKISCEQISQIYLDYYNGLMVTLEKLTLNKYN